MTISRAVLVWIIGLATAVPYATYYLFFEATRDEYAALITFVLFWIFGYWGVVGPILSAIKVRAVFRAIEMASEHGRLKQAIKDAETEDMIIDLIATDNGIPRFLAARVYRMFARKMAGRQASAAGPAGARDPDEPRR